MTRRRAPTSRWKTSSSWSWTQKTRSILLQIILEEEAAGAPMFSAPVLANMIRFYGHAMQGVMGPFLEKNIQTFLEIQNKMTDQTKNMYDPKSFGPEAWTQFMNGQAPMLQNMMSNYIEQSKNMFVQMQEQMNSQSKNMFGNFPFPGTEGKR
jgi:polyhydroxyalkanoate synthesis regulator protein